MLARFADYFAPMMPIIAAFFIGCAISAAAANFFVCLTKSLATAEVRR